MSRSMRAIASAAARYVLPLALIGALALVAVLGAQSRALRQRIIALERRAFLPYTGMIVPPFATRTLDGDTVTIGDPVAGSRQVLFFFTTTCGFCRQTLPAWHTIADSMRVSDRSARVIGVSLDSLLVTRRFVSEAALSFAVSEMRDLRMRAVYRAKAVPLTLVVGEGGIILYARLGALTTSAAIDSVLTAIRTQSGPTPATEFLSLADS